MKKGFTLIEVMGVIIILGILASILAPNVINSITNSKQRLYNTQISNIEGAAESWGAKNLYNLPENDGESILISILQLKLSGLLPYDIKNPKTNELFPDDMKIQITKKGMNFVYDVLEDTGTTNNPIDPTAPIVTLNGGIVQNVEINTPYQELGATAKSRDEVSLDVDIVITKDGNPATIDTTTLGNYDVTYTATYDDKTTSIVRKVQVIDTTKPVLTCSGCPQSQVISIESVNNYLLPEVTAEDNSIIGVNIPVTVSGNFSSIIPGIRKITYSAKDSSGNVGTYELTVIVSDTTAPTYTVSQSLNENTNTATVTITATDTGTGLASYAYSFDNGVTWQVNPTKVFKEPVDAMIIVKDRVNNVRTNTTAVNVPIQVTLKDKINNYTNHIRTGVVVNGVTVNKVYGTKAEKLTMTNYVWFSGQLWQVLETNTTTQSIKLISAQSLSSITYGSTNAWNTSWARKWLNTDVFYPRLKGQNLILDSTFCLDEPTITSTLIDDNGYYIQSVSSASKIATCINKVTDKVGLMTFEDYVYANTGNTATYNGESFLDEDELSWTMTPYTKDGRNNLMWINWFSTGYMTVNTGGTISSVTKSAIFSITNNYSHGVRPVISIKDDAIVKKGTGTKADPYILFNESYLASNTKLNKAKVGDYVYLDESNNPNTFTSEYVARDLTYNTTKDKVRYRIVKINSDGTVKVERADILKNLPSTIATDSNTLVPYYYKAGTCDYSAGIYTDCTNHNYFKPNEGTGNYAYTESENIGYFLNNNNNGYYTWFSTNTKNLINQTNWNLPVGLYGRDYADSLYNTSTTGVYPSRSNDGQVSAYIGLSQWGEIYSGNDLNNAYWLINRVAESNNSLWFTNTTGYGGNIYASYPAPSVRPVLNLKPEVFVTSGEGTMTSPYSLSM